jgi:hypothetical protein
MRFNIYAEEITDRIEIVEKQTPDGTFTGARFYLELPVSLGTGQAQGPFIHRPGDDDSAAVTFWGKRELLKALAKAVAALERHTPSTHSTQASAGADTSAQESPARRAQRHREMAAYHLDLANEAEKPDGHKVWPR